MTALASSPVHTSLGHLKKQAALPFQRVEIGEPIDVSVGLYDGWEHLEKLLGSLGDLRPHLERLTLVLHLPEESKSRSARLHETLRRAVSGADRVIVTAETERLGFWGTSELALAAKPWLEDGLLLIEPEPARALIGSMMWLGKGHALAVLWPASAGLAQVQSLIKRGAAWRGSVQEAEEGDFTCYPTL